MTARIDNETPFADNHGTQLMRILVVEDEKKTASFIRKALQAEGFAVDVLHNGNDALAAVETAHRRRRRDAGL